MSIIGWAIVENVVTMVVTAAIILGIYALGGGLWGFWALVLMLNLNQFKGPRHSATEDERK